jgi:hypothetical protein
VKQVPYWGPANIRYLSKKKTWSMSPALSLKPNLKKKEERQWSYKRNNEVLLHNHCCRAKIISITYSGYVFWALGIQHAKRMRRNILPSVVCPTVHFFPHLLVEVLYGAVNTQLVSFCKCLFLTCQLDYMFRPLYKLGHHQVPQLLVLFTCNANYD